MGVGIQGIEIPIAMYYQGPFGVAASIELEADVEPSIVNRLPHFSPAWIPYLFVQLCCILYTLRRHEPRKIVPPIDYDSST